MKAEILSFIYTSIRRAVISSTYIRQRATGQPRDLEDAVELGDRWLKRMSSWAVTFPIPDTIGVRLYDLQFPSPLTLSAFKDQLSIISIWMRLGLGGACIKTVMKEPRPGNLRPRLQEVSINGHDCLINAMGLPGHGVEGKIEEFANSDIFSHKRPIGISIGGSTMLEYQHNFNAFLNFLSFHPDKPAYFELNISCPNTPEGQDMTRNPDLLEHLLTHMRNRTDKVIGVKLSPDMHDDDLVRYAKLVREFGRTYLNLGNTTARRCEDVGLPAGAITIGRGGLSGPALYQRTLAMTNLVSLVDIPIIATGGVDSAEKVKELLDNGATLVGMATAVVKDMYCIPRINYQLAARMNPGDDVLTGLLSGM